MPLRQSKEQESLASMVVNQYKKSHTRTPEPPLSTGNQVRNMKQRPERRLSQVSIGSKLVIHQMDGKNVQLGIDRNAWRV